MVRMIHGSREAKTELSAAEVAASILGGHASAEEVAALAASVLGAAEDMGYGRNDGATLEELAAPIAERHGLSGEVVIALISGAIPEAMENYGKA